jgi:DNA-binding CsgD family transcriptional regulator
MAILMKSDPDTSRVVLADRHHPEFVRWVEDYIASLLSPHEAPTTGMSRKVIETRGPILIPRMAVEALTSMMSETGQRYVAEHPMPTPTGELGLLMVPMRSGPAVVGTLAITDWGCRQLLGDADLDWMQRAADRVGITIENAQMRNKALLRSERIEALSEVAMAITSSSGYALTFKLILARLVASLRADAADIVLVDDDSGHMFVAAAAGFRSPLVGEVRTEVPSDAGKRWIIEHHVAPPSTLEWIGQSRRWMLAREGMKSSTAAPLVLGQRFVGALEVFSRSEIEPDPEFLAFLDAMAAHAAIAFDNATMHDLVRRGGKASMSARVSPPPALSDRELQILRLVVEGASNRDVAERLHLSQNTIKFHIRQLLEKTDVANRTELATRAVHQGWV